MQTFKRHLAILLSISLLLLGLQGSIAQAAMIPTESLSGVAAHDYGREDLADFVQRDQVSAKLAAFGISPEAAQERVHQLSGEELAHLNAQIDDLPAGAGVAGVAIIVLLTLVFLDIFGVTDIFTFIKPIK